MKVDVFMPLYVSDYDRDTKRLTLEQDGAYNRLLRDYWVSGSPPNDDKVLALIVRVDIKHWRKLRPALVGFFEIKDGRWVQKRIEIELSKARERREIAALNGKRGGRPKKMAETQQKPSGFSVGLAPDNPEPNPDHNPQESSSPSPSNSSLRSEENDTGLGASKSVLEAVDAARSAQWASLQIRLVEAAGEALADMASAPGVANIAPIDNLLKAGSGPPCDLDRDVLPVIRQRCARAKPRSIRSWNFFTDAIVEARDARLRGAPAQSEATHDHSRNDPGPSAAYPDSRRANTERRRDSWARAFEASPAPSAGGDGDAGGAGPDRRGAPSYPALAYAGQPQRDRHGA